jgi:hypothetical protein
LLSRRLSRLAFSLGVNSSFKLDGKKSSALSSSSSSSKAKVSDALRSRSMGRPRDGLRKPVVFGEPAYEDVLSPQMSLPIALNSAPPTELES